MLVLEFLQLIVSNLKLPRACQGGKLLLGVLLLSEHKLFHGCLPHFFADFVSICITIKTSSHLLLAIFHLILALVFVKIRSAGLKLKAG